MSEIIIPGGWRERLDALSTRRGAWVVTGFVIVMVGVALTMWSRGTPAQIAPPATGPPAAAPAAVAPASPAAPAPTAAAIYVDVAGAVRRPGLYRLEAGARVADAIQAAGGPVARADLDPLNLAQLLTDGAKIEVTTRGQGGAMTAPAAATSPSLAGAIAAPSPSVPIVNINTADEATLELIPGVGPVTANAILQYRSRIGSFSSIEQLLDIDGIGPGTVENIRPYITL